MDWKRFLVTEVLSLVFILPPANKNAINTGAQFLRDGVQLILVSKRLLFFNGVSSSSRCSSSLLLAWPVGGGWVNQVVHCLVLLLRDVFLRHHLILLYAF